MLEIINEIEKYTENILKDNDLIALEIMLNYSLWLNPISYTTFFKNEKKFKSLFKKIISRSIKIKFYNLNNNGLNQKLKEFILEILRD